MNTFGVDLPYHNFQLHERTVALQICSIACNVIAEPRIGTMEKHGDLYGKLDGTATTCNTVSFNTKEQMACFQKELIEEKKGSSTKIIRKTIC